MEPLGVLEDVESESNALAVELTGDSLQSSFHAEPEVDLLRSRSRRDVPIELGDGLNLLDPRVDVRLKLVEEGGVDEEGGRGDGVDGDSGRFGAALRKTRIKWELGSGCGNVSRRE